MAHSFHHVSYPVLSQEQCKNAKLYATREDFVKTLPNQIFFMEVGVAAGDFSEFVIQTCEPRLSVLIDLYNQKDILYVDGREPRYSSDENLQFVIDRMDKYRGIDIIQEDSLTALPRLLNRKEYFDFIYLDASHKYQDVVLDIEASCALLKDDGILGLNDYIWKDEDGREYGVILAVNKFLVANKDWEVIAFALHDKMYADIYLRRKMPQPV
jgi:hypothetical protein